MRNFILAIVIVTTACHSTISLVTTGVKREFDTVVAVQDIPNIPYNRCSDPYITCLRENYARKTHDGQVHWENIIPFDYCSNTSGIPIGTIKKHRTLSELKRVEINVYQPLFGVFTAAMLKDVLLDTLRIHVVEQFSDTGAVEVLFNKNQKFYLKKVQGVWKIYDTGIQ